MNTESEEYKNRSGKESVCCAFIGCSCSKTPHSVDWNQNNGWIIFGSSRNVVLVSPASADNAAVIAGTLCEHDGDVVCVKWIKDVADSDHTSLAISGSTDSRAILWQFERKGRLRKMSTCVGHSMSINHVCGLKIGNIALLCTCSADSTIRIWAADISEEGKSATEVQSINVERSGFALCADMKPWKNGVIMASGHDDKRIHLFWKGEWQDKFERVMTLSGHEDWIRGISFQPNSGASETTSASPLLLASCSQDSYVRLWRLSVLMGDGRGDEKSNDEVITESRIRLKRQTFSILNDQGGPTSCSAELEAVLAGHDDWVYSVQWQPQGASRLLTASMDKCLIVWEPEPASGLWLEKTRLGVVGGPVASGFYGGLFGPDGVSILGHTFQGGFHIWDDQQAEWHPAVAPGGHFASVEDISWDPNGHYLLSCGADQTTRLYAPWRREHKTVTVHEIARPQVHGYDMQCVVSVSSSCFVSAAEEKIIRAFMSTKNCAENYLRITNTSGEQAVQLLSVLQDSTSGAADGACVPSLGLSNKAMFAGETTKANTINSNRVQDDEEAEVADVDSTISFQPAHLTAPPTENCLMQNTLWPEVHKLYGHGSEIFAVACNHAGTVIVSSAKANKPEQAHVILWSTKDWQQRGQLIGHSLTVTQVAFSPNDTHLLTVSRDRTWCLYRRGDCDFDWIPVGNTDKKTAVHTRIIWACSWAPDSRYFVTASRDKKVVVWKLTNENTGTCTGTVHQVGSVLDAPNSTTAVAMCSKQFSAESYLVAIGLETGEIILYEWCSVSQRFQKLFEMDRNMAHALTVKRLQFRPVSDADWLHPASGLGDNDLVYLASCSDDHCVKVFQIYLGGLKL